MSAKQNENESTSSAPIVSSEHLDVGSVLLDDLRQFEALPSPPALPALMSWLDVVSIHLTDTARRIVSSKNEYRRLSESTAPVLLPVLDLRSAALVCALGSLIGQVCLLGQLSPPLPPETINKSLESPSSEILNERITSPFSGPETSATEQRDFMPATTQKRYIRCAASMPKGSEISPARIAAAASATGSSVEARVQCVERAVVLFTTLLTASFKENSGLPSGFTTKMLSEALLACFQLRCWPGALHHLADALVAGLRASMCSHDIEETPAATGDANTRGRECMIGMDAYSRRVYMGALLQILWQDVVRDCALVFPGEKIPTTPHTGLSIQPKVRFLAGLELVSAMLHDKSSQGVQVLFEAVSDAADMNDVVTAEPAMNAISSILSQPALEIMSAESYLGYVAPQLVRLLSIRGPSTAWWRETAARTINAILRERKFCPKPVGALRAPFYPYKVGDEHVALYDHVLRALMEPLLRYIAPADEEAYVNDEVVVASADELVAAIENLHAVLSIAPLPPRITLRMLPVVLPLLDVICFCRGNSLRAGLAGVSQEVVGMLLRSLPPSWTAFCVLSSISAEDAVDEFLARWREFLDVCHQRQTELPPHLPPKTNRYRFEAAGPSAIQVVWNRLDVVKSSVPLLAAPILETPKEGIMADLFTIGSRIGVGKAPQPDEKNARLGEIGAVNINGFSLEVRANGICDVLAVGSGKKTNTVEADVVDYRLACFKAETGAECLFTYLFVAFAEARCGFDAEALRPKGLPERDTALLLTMMERLGPSVLRSSITSLQTIRSVLHMSVLSIGAEIPPMETVGLSLSEDADASLPARIHSQACDRFGIPATAVGAGFQEQPMEVVGMCLDILCAFAAALSSEGDDLDHVPPRERLGRWAWLRSTLPILAALSDCSDKEIAEMCSSLRGFILLIPAPTQRSGGEEGQGLLPDSNAAGRGPNAEHLLKEGMTMLMDPAPALQTVGIRRLAAAVRARPKEWELQVASDGALPAGAWTIFDIALKQLAATDTAVVLAAVDLVSSFLATYSAMTLRKVLTAYDSDRLSLRTRVKLGECLSAGVHVLGSAGVLQRFGIVVTAACMKIGVAGWRRQAELEAACAEREDDTSLHELEDFIDLRSSALVVLGDCTVYLLSDPRFPVRDVLSGCLGVLQMDQMPQLHRSAAYALRCLADGLSRSSDLVNDSDILELLGVIKDSLGSVSQADMDEVTKQHLQDARTSMRQLLDQAVRRAHHVDDSTRSGARVVDRAAAKALRESGSSIDSVGAPDVLAGVTISPWQTLVRELK